MERVFTILALLREKELEMSYIMLHHALNRGELCAEALCGDFCFLIFSNYCCSLSQAHFTVA
jgi:hypothetical protein